MLKKTLDVTIPKQWLFVELQEIATVISGGTPAREIQEYWIDGEIPWVTPTDITSNSDRTIIKSEESITGKGLKNSSAKLLPANSLLMTSRATLGESKINLIPMCTNQGFKSFIPKANVDIWFLYYQMKQLKRIYIRYGIGTTFLEVNKKDTDSFVIPYPPLPEQQKIAEVLTTIDNVIEKTEQLIEKLKSIKKGLMQDLFTRGVTPDGKLRPAHNDAPELYKESELGWIPKDWEVDRFSNSIELIHGYQFREYDFTNEGLPIVKIGQLGINGKLIMENLSYIDIKRLNTFQKVIVNRGDVLMALTGATLGKAVIVDKHDGFLLQNYRVGRFEPKDDTIIKSFIYYLLVSDDIQRKIMNKVNVNFHEADPFVITKLTP